MHKLIERQIRRFLGETDLEKIPQEWMALLRAVSDAYTHADADRELTLRSLELSSVEFAKLNEQLAREKEIIEEKVQERTRELDYEKKKLDEIAQNMSTGAILLDPQGKVIFVNYAAEKFLGGRFPSSDVLQEFFEFFATAPVAAHLDRCLKGEPSEIPEVDADSKIFRILFRCLSSDDATAGHLVWIEDITQAKLLDRAKSEFVAVASHEMRTPLAIIRGQAELLLESATIVASPEETKRRISSIRQSSIRLLDIVNDFLNLTQFEENRVALTNEEFDLVPLIKETVADFGKLTSQKNLSLTFSEPSAPLPPVFADREWVEQVLTSLIGNAAHYTEKGGIEVRAEEGPTHEKIFVKDTGIGIEPGKQHFLFQKFQITGKRFMHSKEYGSGMGLYIAKMIVERMGGKIKLEESAVDKGSTFSFTVPRAAGVATP